MKYPECSSAALRTAFIKIKNEEIVSSFCKSDRDRDKHLKHNKDMQEAANAATTQRLLSLGYIRHDTSDNVVYYVKNYDRMPFDDAHGRCKEDQTSLPIPRSGLINVYFSVLAGLAIIIKGFEKYGVYH